MLKTYQVGGKVLVGYKNPDVFLMFMAYCLGRSGCVK